MSPSRKARLRFMRGLQEVQESRRRSTSRDVGGACILKPDRMERDRDVHQFSERRRLPLLCPQAEKAGNRLSENSCSGLEFWQSVRAGS